LLRSFLCSIVGFTVNEIIVPRKHNNTIVFFVDQTKRFEAFKRCANRVSRKPFEIALDLRNVVFDYDFTDLAG